jgi:hypothetical protein
MSVAFARIDRSITTTDFSEDGRARGGARRADSGLVGGATKMWIGVIAELVARAGEPCKPAADTRKASISAFKLQTWTRRADIITTRRWRRTLAPPLGVFDSSMTRACVGEARIDTSSVRKPAVEEDVAIGLMGTPASGHQARDTEHEHESSCATWEVHEDEITSSRRLPRASFVLRLRRRMCPHTKQGRALHSQHVFVGAIE